MPGPVVGPGLRSAAASAAVLLLLAAAGALRSIHGCWMSPGHGSSSLEASLSSEESEFEMSPGIEPSESLSEDMAP